MVRGADCRREDSPRPRRCRRGRVVGVRSKDGIRLHAEVFGPEDGYPIVLAHGITCAIRVWAYQIADLAKRLPRHRLRPPRPRSKRRARRGAAATASTSWPPTSTPCSRRRWRRGSAPSSPGHSMGGIAITSWAERYPDRVPQRADAVALINTTTGDLLRHVQFLPVPPPLADGRVRAAGTLLKTFGAAPLLRAVDRPSRRFVSTIAVGRDADPAIAEFVFELFTETPPAGRGGWARALVDSLGTHQHIGLKNLTVPTLVIGSEKDRLLPMVSSRRIAKEAPNLASVRRTVRRPLRDPGAPRRGQQAPALADRVGAPRTAAPAPSAARLPGPPRRPHAAPTGPRRRGSRSTCRRFRFRPRRCRRPVCATTARTSSTSPAAPRRSGRRARIPLRPSNGRRSRSDSVRRRRTASRSPSSARSRRSAGGSGSNVRASVKPSRMPGPSSPGLTSNVMNTGPSSDSASPEQPLARQNGVS